MTGKKGKASNEKKAAKEEEATEPARCRRYKREKGN
jgi:hypothetical protein